MSTLRLNLFGGFALLGADGATVVIAARKCRALLAYVALQPRPTARERLAELLWGDGGAARARASLRQALTVLRQEIPGGDAWLAASAECVAVDRQALSVDVVEAEELLHAGQLAAALELCGRGELLAGINPGAAEFEDWCDEERRRWRERETATLTTLAEQARERGEQRTLLTLGRRLLKLEPWNEEAHRTVMQALAALGRRSEALRQYQIAAEVLRTELGVAPDQNTERLLLQIRQARSAPVERAPMPVPAELPPAPTRLEAPAGDAAAPVGRVLEIVQIEGLLQGCRSSGRGHLILVRGEPGMGKTTFLQQALGKARAVGFPTHLIEVSDSGAGRSTDVLRGLLAALDAEAHTPPAHRRAVSEMLGNPLTAEEAAVAAAMQPDARAEAHIQAIEALVADAGARQPRVIAIEDLQWCEPATTRIICALAAAASGHGIVTIITCRSGEEPSAELAWTALLRRGSLTSIDLGPLAAEDAARLAARYPGLTPEVTRRCLDRAAGHPLFLVQLLESGAADAAEDHVPQSVQAAVLARLGGVSPGERRALEGAAVVGGPISLAQMLALLERDEPEPGTPAATLVHRLVQQGWLRLDGARLIIAHDLLGAAVRSALDGATRAHLHHWAAQCWAGVDPLRSAEHLDRAGDPGAALGYLSVARAALEDRRLDLAETILSRIDACPAAPPVAFAALCLRGDVRRERGDPAGSHDVFARAAAHARTSDQRARARLGMAAALRMLDRHQEALACLGDAESVLAPDDHVMRAPLEHLRGNLLFTGGDLPGCRGAHERALAHARKAEAPADEVVALSGLGDAYYLEGKMASASRAFEASRELARVHGILRMEAACSVMLGLTNVYDNRLPAALAATARAVDVAIQIADVRQQSLAHTVRATVLREAGEFAAAKVHVEKNQAAARRLGSERLEAMALAELARILVAEGPKADRGEALRLARQSLALCQRSDGLKVTGASILSVLARVEPTLEASRAALRQGEALLDAGCPCHAHLDLREAAMALALERREWAEVRRHAAALAAYFTTEPPARATVVLEKAQLLAAAGERGREATGARRLAELDEQARAAGLVVLAAWPAL